jgi:hypothetical protein
MDFTKEQLSDVFIKHLEREKGWKIQEASAT